MTTKVFTAIVIAIVVMPRFSFLSRHVTMTSRKWRHYGPTRISITKISLKAPTDVHNYDHATESTAPLYSYRHKGLRLRQCLIPPTRTAAIATLHAAIANMT